MTHNWFFDKEKIAESWWIHVMALKAWMWYYVYALCHWPKQFLWTNTMSVGWKCTLIAHNV